MTSHVYFDLDGTLADPYEGITRCIRYALDRLDVQHPSDEILAECIGPPLLGSFRSMVGGKRAPQALEIYRERFSDFGWKENVLYPGITSTLEILTGRGHALFVATSKPVIYADKIVKHLKLDHYFSKVYGSELNGVRSNKVDLLSYAIFENPTNQRRVMVGDRKHDVVAAIANKMHAIGVTYGYGTKEELLAAGANDIVTSPLGLSSAMD